MLQSYPSWVISTSQTVCMIVVDDQNFKCYSSSIGPRAPIDQHVC